MFFGCPARTNLGSTAGCIGRQKLGWRKSSDTMVICAPRFECVFAFLEFVFWIYTFTTLSFPFFYIFRSWLLRGGAQVDDDDGQLTLWIRRIGTTYVRLWECSRRWKWPNDRWVTMVASDRFGGCYSLFLVPVVITLFTLFSVSSFKMYLRRT